MSGPPTKVADLPRFFTCDDGGLGLSDIREDTGSGLGSTKDIEAMFIGKNQTGVQSVQRKKQERLREKETARVAIRLES